MDYTPLTTARHLLDDLWKERAWLRGRCMGIKREGIDNPFQGSNINLAIGEEFIDISQVKEGEIKIQEFVKTTNTKLGNEIKKILKEAGLVIEKGDD